MTPSPWLVASVTFVAALGSQLLPPSPLGTSVLVLTYVAGATAIWWLSGRSGWTSAHAAAVAMGALSAFALIAFGTEPIGAVSAAEKLGHNIAVLLTVSALGALATTTPSVSRICMSRMRTAVRPASSRSIWVPPIATR